MGPRRLRALLLGSSPQPCARQGVGALLSGLFPPEGLGGASRASGSHWISAFGEFWTCLSGWEWGDQGVPEACSQEGGWLQPPVVSTAPPTSPKVPGSGIFPAGWEWCLGAKTPFIQKLVKYSKKKKALALWNAEPNLCHTRGSQSLGEWDPWIGL